MSDSDFDEELQFQLKALALAFGYDFYGHVTETSPGNSQINTRNLLALGCWARNQRIWVLRLVKFLNRGIVHAVNTGLVSRV